MTIEAVDEMILEGYCKDCDKWFNAHWTNYPDQVGGALNPYCLDCKGHNVVVYSDEMQYEMDDVIMEDEED